MPMPATCVGSFRPSENPFGCHHLAGRRTGSLKIDSHDLRSYSINFRFASINFSNASASAILPDMPKRYDQYCPVAHALELVGERWALLVVRELLGGPKRYTDLA